MISQLLGSMSNHFPLLANRQAILLGFHSTMQSHCLGVEMTETFRAAGRLDKYLHKENVCVWMGGGVGGGGGGGGGGGLLPRWFLTNFAEW